MKKLTLGGFALLSFFAASAVEMSQAEARVVCARGVHRAGCVAAPRGRAVVVHRPAVRCRWVWSRGVRVRRCW